MTDNKLPLYPISPMHPSHGRFTMGWSDTSLNGRVVPKGMQARFYSWTNGRVSYLALSANHKEWLYVDLQEGISTRGDVRHWLGHEDTYVCKECGHRETNDGWIHSAKLRELQECFHCNLWLNKIREPSETRIIDQDWNCYGIGKEPSEQELRRSGEFLGYGGRRFEFKPLTSPDGGPVESIISHNVWYGGVVPERFRDRLPQTHTLIPNPPPKPIDFGLIKGD